MLRPIESATPRCPCLFVRWFWSVDNIKNRQNKYKITGKNHASVTNPRRVWILPGRHYFRRHFYSRSSADAPHCRQDRRGGLVRGNGSEGRLFIVDFDDPQIQTAPELIPIAVRPFFADVSSHKSPKPQRQHNLTATWLSGRATSPRAIYNI